MSCLTEMYNYLFNVCIKLYPNLSS